jgi:4-azaleucine resistance transporter AzlC
MAVADQTNPRPTSLGVLRQGLAAAWPIGLGYLPIGLALGVLGRNAGLDPLHIGLMSLLVFAGSAQFIAVAMIGAGAAPAVIVATVFMVNLRHLLMSGVLTVHLRGAGQGFLALFAYGVTDESFAVNHTRFRSGGWDRQRALVVNQAANAVWILATVAGGYLGGFLVAGAFGLDFALIAMFLCLLVYQLRSRLHQVTGVVAGVLAVAWSLLVPGHSYIMVAACGAATAGFLLGRRGRGRP